MFAREKEEKHLVLANRHVSEAEARIAHVRQLLEQGRVLGNLKSESRELLREMLDSLDLMQIHRKQILAKLADLYSHP